MIASLSPSAARPAPPAAVRVRDYISYSAIKTYQQCPLRHFFKYIAGLAEETVSASLVFGRFTARSSTTFASYLPAILSHRWMPCWLCTSWNGRTGMVVTSGFAAQNYAEALETLNNVAKSGGAVKQGWE